MGVFLEKLTFSNYRNFTDEVSLSFHAPLTVLVGKNSCGKSSILELIQRHAYNKLSDSEIGKIRLKVLGGYEPPGWSFSNMLNIPVFKLRSTRGVEEEIIPGRGSRSEEIDFVMWLNHRKFDYDLLERLNNYTKMNFGFEIKHDSEGWFAYYRDRKIRVNDLSAGVQSMLAIETALLISQKYDKLLLLIEEIENFLHPTKLRYYIEKLKNASLQDRLQIIMTTHSPIVASLLSPQSVVRIDSKGNIHQLDNEDKALSEAWEQLIDPIKGEVFFADKAIIYEGISDQLIIEGALKSDPNYRYPMDGITSIKLDGVRHYDKVTQILKKFCISYLAIVDRDKNSPIEEVLTGNFLTLKNPYGEIEDAVPLEDWIRIAIQDERDASMWLLYNLLNLEDFPKFSDAVARSFGKNKLSYAHRLGKLYKNMNYNQLKSRGIYILVKVIRDFISGRDLHIGDEIPDVDKNLRNRKLLMIEDGFVDSSDLLEELEKKDLFPKKILPFCFRKSTYGVLNKTWLPKILNSSLQFALIVGEEYDFRALREVLSRVNAEWKDEFIVINHISGRKSLILRRRSLDLEDIIKLAESILICNENNNS